MGPTGPFPENSVCTTEGKSINYEFKFIRRKGDLMSQMDRIAEIEDLTIKEFKEEIQFSLESLKRGARPGNTMELLATALNISFLGDNLKLAVERWLQLDLWEKMDSERKQGRPL
jgi:hypothetical protein